MLPWMVKTSLLVLLITNQPQYLAYGQRSGSRIVGGTPVISNSEYPFYAFPNGRYLCGATLIHGDILVSAAHCGNITWGNGVWLGGTSLVDRSASTFYSVNQTILHPLYNIPSSKNNAT
jgi:Trypsin